MTLRRSGWIGERPFAEIIDLETGKADKWICLVCKGELPVDARSFDAHDCLNYLKRKGPKIRRSEPVIEATVEESMAYELPPVLEFASEVARSLAIEHGLGVEDFSGHSPSGATGFTAGDVRRIVEEWPPTMPSDEVGESA